MAERALLGQLVSNVPSARAGYRSAKTRHPLSPKRATGRVVLSAAVGLLAALITPAALPWPLCVMVGWVATALFLLGSSWEILRRSDARTTELRAGDEDPGRFAMFVIAVLASVFSVFAATMVLALDQAVSDRGFWVVLTVVSVALSWFVTHTEYTFRYAHLFYAGETPGGLQFPGTERPSDMDFAYYSFTIGMCFQVSDVQITTADIRRVTLGHALLSFLFNTTILALGLNVMLRLLDS